MRAHFGDANVLDQACRLLRNVTCPDDSVGGNRKQRAADSGAIEVVVAAMLRHPQEAKVQHQGSAALRNICASVDDVAATRTVRSDASARTACAVSADRPDAGAHTSTSMGRRAGASSARSTRSSRFV